MMYVILNVKIFINFILIFLQVFFKQALNYSKSIITVSYTTEKKIKNYFTKYKFKIKPIEIIYNVFQYDQSSDFKLNSSLKDLEQFRKKLIYTGGYEEEKIYLIYLKPSKSN